jgi:cytochrome-b5 reductase
LDLSVSKDTDYERRYVFELPNGDGSLLPVASCVLFKGPEELKDNKGKPIVRPYTPTSASDEPGVLEFVIKRYENGLMSQHVHNMKPGDAISIKGPIPKFPWKRKHRPS